jgi:hypothetical protein
LLGIVTIRNRHENVAVRIDNSVGAVELKHSEDTKSRCILHQLYSRRHGTSRVGKIVYQVGKFLDIALYLYCLLPANNFRLAQFIAGGGDCVHTVDKIHVLTCWFSFAVDTDMQDFVYLFLLLFVIFGH